MKAAIPFLRPNLVKADQYLQYLRRIDESRLYSNFGPLNKEFEERILKEHFNSQGAVVTTQNCTLGLILALTAMKRKGGRYVLLPSFTFAASAQAVLWAGLEPYFVDIDPDTWSMDINLVHGLLEELGEQVAAVLVYSCFGNNIPLEPYNTIHNRKVPVIVDAAPGFGASCNGRHFGQGFDGAVLFSFHATKPFGIGEGGLVYSQDTAIIQSIRKASNFGFLSPGISDQIGLNAKLPELSAAVGLATLDVFGAKLEKRRELYQDYQSALAQHEFMDAGWHQREIRGLVPHQFFPLLCPEQVDPQKLSCFLEESGIGNRRYFKPHCAEQAIFSEYKKTSLPVTQNIASRIICLPLWEEMTAEQIGFIVGTLKRCSTQS
jgi:dTDP-4-amino-4,6-dideoxygalactose transaminase